MALLVAFQRKGRDTVMHVLRLLCEGLYVRRESGMALWAFVDRDAVDDQIDKLLHRHQALYRRFGLPKSMAERIAQEVAQLMANTLH